MEVINVSGNSSCDFCSHYSYNEEEDYYECDISMDEDEYARFLMSSIRDCPYFQIYDEYKIVRKQM